MTHSTDPSPVVQELRNVLEALRDAVRVRSDSAVMALEAAGLPIEPYLHSGITRAYVCEDLTNSSDVLGFRRKKVPFHGILLRSDKYEIRLLKAEHILDLTTDPPTVLRALPVPKTFRRMEWYRQPEMGFGTASMLFPDMFDERIRLLALWDTDRDYQMSGFDLAAPKFGGSARGSVEHHWYLPDVLDDPAFGTAVAPATDAAATYDLPRRLADLALPGTEHMKTGTDDLHKQGDR